MKNSAKELITIIEPGRSGINYFSDLWRYRELFFILSWRDVQVRYKQTYIGVAWALIQPTLTLIIFTFVFGSIADLPSEGDLPYPILVLMGLLPWQLFANSVVQSSNSLIGNEQLVTKVYFPRIIIPSSTIVTHLLDFGIALLLFTPLIWWYGMAIGWNLLLLPLLLLFLVLLSLGSGFIMAAMNVRYRDFRYALPFLMQLGLYLSPVGFSSKVVPSSLQVLYSLNPMVGIIDGFRWSLCPTSSTIAFPWQTLLISVVVTLSIFAIGLQVFRKIEKSVADII